MLILVLTLCLGACSQVTGPESEETAPVGNSVDLARATSTRTSTAAATSSAAAISSAAPSLPEATLPPPSATLQLAPMQPTKKIVPEVFIVTPDFPPAPTPADPFLRELISQAKDDLSRRMKIELDLIKLVKIEMVVWSDASLGCPQPGMAYIQVPQEGYVILLQAGERTYNYHGGGDPSRPPFLCENPVGPNITFPPPRD